MTNTQPDTRPRGYRLPTDPLPAPGYRIDHHFPCELDGGPQMGREPESPPAPVRRRVRLRRWLLAHVPYEWNQRYHEFVEELIFDRDYFQMPPE